MKTLTQFAGKIYPDKTFAVGIVPPKKKKLDDSLYDKDIEETYDSYTEYYNKYGRTKKRTVQFVAKTVDDRRFIKGQQSSRKLRRYGSQGITKFGKKSITCFGSIMQKKYRIGCLGFGTCTVPGYSSAILRIIGIQWGEITRRFFQKLRRSCAKKNRAFIYFGVTEIQEKRYRRTGLPVPHLHFGYVCRDNRSSEFYFTAAQTRQFWREAITESINRYDSSFEREEVSFDASIDIQLVKKSIGAYMAKYLTKGVKTTAKIIADGYSEMLPKQWWFASMQMKKALKASTVRTTQSENVSFFYGLEKLLYGCKVTWCNFVDVEVAPGEYRIYGVVGRLSDEYYKEFEKRINQSKLKEAFEYGNNQKD